VLKDRFYERFAMIGIFQFRTSDIKPSVIAAGMQQVFILLSCHLGIPSIREVQYLGVELQMISQF